MNTNLMGEKNKLLHTWECTLVCISVFLYLRFRSFIPYDVMSTAGYDDGWFMHAAGQLLQLHWFGSYDHATLIKGPMYPFFLAFTSLSGISLQTTTAIFHVIAASFLIYTLSPYIKSFLLKYLFFILILFIQFPIQRIIRDEFSLSILIIVISLSGLVFLEERIKINRKKILVGFLGLFLSIFILTREDGFVSILPPLIFLYLLSLLIVPSKLKEKTVSLVIIFAIMFTSINLYKLINLSKYGSYVGVELVDNDYQSALNAIYRVREEGSLKYVEVTNSNLKAIYKISPTLNKVAPLIDNSSWKAHGCSIDPKTCGQTGTGYFMWSLRDALYKSGHYSTPSDAKYTYRKIALEINSACDAKEIKCRHKLFSKIPGYDLFNFKEFVEVFYSGILATTKINYLDTITTSPSHDSDLRYSDLLNISYVSKKNTNINFYRISGWFYDEKNPTKWFDIEVKYNEDKNNISKNIIAQLERKSSEDLKYHFNQSLAINQRFEIFLPCLDGNCSLLVNGVKISGNLRSFKAGQYSTDGIFNVDEVTNLIDSRQASITKSKQSAAAVSFFNNLAKLYNTIGPYILTLGFISLVLLVALSVFSFHLEKKMALCFFVWSVYFWKTFFLSVIYYFWIPGGLNFLYLYPSIIILPIASFFSFSTLFDIFYKKFNLRIIR
jgi:hypothetical protein